MTSVSWQARLINALFKAVVRPFAFPVEWTPGAMRRRQAVYRMIAPLLPYPRGLTIETVALPRCTAEWITTSAGRTGRVVLHFHGGGYILLSPRVNRDSNARLGEAAGAQVLSVAYRKLPDHVWPAAVDDAVDAYRHLLASGHRSDNIVIVGESGGAHLTLITLLALRDRGLPRPAGAIAVSPLVNFACDYPSMAENRDSEVVLRPDALRGLGRLLANGRDLKSPEISPAFADFRDLPPLFLLASGAELVRDDVRVIRDLALAAGVSVRHLEVPGMPHAWTAVFTFLPEARQALQEMAQFIREVTPTPL